MRFQIVLIKPRGFDFVESFREVMEASQECLSRLGHAAQIQTNRVDGDAIPILFGAHHLDPSTLDRLPRDSVLFNLEQLEPGYPWFSEPFLRTLSRFRVWDYSLKNVDYLRASGVSPAALHVPFGYSPCLTRIAPAAEEDVDVLFFGVPSERRLRILRELGNRGLNVVALNNVWGAQRDAWIARSKVVINIHLTEHGRFEIVRVLFLLANGKAVVSESDADGFFDERLQGRLAVVAYDRLVDTCLRLVQSVGERMRLQQLASAVADESALQFLPDLARAVATFSMSVNRDQTQV